MGTGLGVLVVVVLLKVGGFPIARAAFRELPFGGLGAAGVIGLLLAGVPLWFLSSVGVLPYTRLTAWLAVGALLIAGAVTARRTGLRMSREHRLLLLVTEAVFLVTFVIGLVVVSHVPNLWGGEKPLDMALIQSSLNTRHFPPADPWLSGGTLDYYYYLGQYLLSFVIRVAGVDPVEGYNACVALVWSMAATTAFGLGAVALGRSGVRRALVGGAAVSGLVAIGGNVSGVRQVFSVHGSLSDYAWFTPARVMDNMPNDFPVFQMIYGELHAHVIAVPVMLVCCAFALQVLQTGARLSPRVVMMALAVGSLVAINAWSAPVMLGLLAASALASRAGVKRSAVWIGALLVTVAVIYAPYLLRLSTDGSQGVGIVHDRDGLASYAKSLVGIYGFALAALAVWIVPRIPKLWLPGIVVVILIGALIHDLGSIALLATLIAVTLFVMSRTDALAVRFGLLLAAVGLACVLLPELVFLRDGLSGTPGYRANTVFKFGFTAFLLLGAGGGVLLASALRRNRRSLGAAIVLAAGLLVYPALGSWARTGGFRSSPHLDGLRWLAATAPGDPGAIAWLRAYAPANAVLLEAVGPEYSPDGHARMSVFTGRSAVLEYPQFSRFYGRGASVPQRTRDVATAYLTHDSAVAERLFARYGVDFVIVGPLERKTYPRLDEAKFGRIARVVYRNRGTAIYAVSDGTNSEVPVRQSIR